MRPFQLSSLVCRILLPVGAWLALGALWNTAPSPADEAVNRPATEQLAFFESKIRPLLEKHCLECHGTKTQEGKLRLDNLAGMLTGGVSGPAVQPGKADDSLLMVAVSYRNEELQMPPDGKLSDTELDDLRQWISLGTPHPDSASGGAVVPASRVDLDEGRKFWAFQPPRAAPLPTVHQTDWPRTAIDPFILATLESHQLSPSPAVDKGRWLRRVTFDLVGLPPTPEELESFLNDHSPDASSRVVDRLLASPHYGERWGRFWLDVVRYADSNGLDENVAHGNAWRYRDYVVRSLNQDKPFPEFAQEQLAGDLLPAANEGQRHERLIATGLLALGPKVLAEVDELKMEMDIVDEQIDTFGRAFLAMTLGCSRCHDHKFDPIRTDDYYALAGIFKSTKAMESFTKVARWYENEIATPEELAAKAAHAESVANQKLAIQQTVEAANQALLGTLGAEAKLPDDAEKKYPEEVQSKLKQLRDELAKLEKAAPAISSAMGVTEGKVSDTAVCIRGSHLTLGRVVPRGVPAVMAQSHAALPSDASGRRQLAEWLVDRHHPLTARVFVNRVWRWHFGRGLVESTDNFGRLGDRPSHPELLDWLAVEWMELGWSTKVLHRQLLLSATYEQSSRLDEASLPAQAALAVDPDNRLLWRFPRRRLEAEAIRDALLASSDQLDLQMGGSLLHVGNRQYLFDHTSKDTTRYDVPRRSIYLPVIRNNVYEVFQLFDATDATVPSGDRATSTVATQALFSLNSDLMLDVAKALATQTSGLPGDDRARIEHLYLRCFGRRPADDEVLRATSFVARFAEPLQATGMSIKDAREQGWQALCQSLLATNEFVYVE